MIGTNFGIYRPSASVTTSGSHVGSGTPTLGTPQHSSTPVRIDTLPPISVNSVGRNISVNRNTLGPYSVGSASVPHFNSHTPGSNFISNTPIGQPPSNIGITNLNVKAESEDTQPLNLGDFMAQLKDYTPTIPDEIILQYMARGGFDTEDERMVRLISLIAQKYATDVCTDTLQHCKARVNAGQAAQGGNGAKTPKATKDKRFTLSNEDLSSALADYGITVRKPIYFP